MLASCPILEIQFKNFLSHSGTYILRGESVLAGQHVIGNELKGHFKCRSLNQMASVYLCFIHCIFSK